MRLINVTTNHTNEDIDDILYSLSENEIHKIKVIYDKIRFVEYVKDNFNCMFFGLLVVYNFFFLFFFFFQAEDGIRDSFR